MIYYGAKNGETVWHNITHSMHTAKELLIFTNLNIIKLAGTLRNGTKKGKYGKMIKELAILTQKVREMEDKLNEDYDLWRNGKGEWIGKYDKVKNKGAISK